MKLYRRLLALLVSFSLLLVLICAQAQQDQPFTEFVAKIRAEALQQGISEKTVNKYLTGLKAPRKSVIYKFHHEPQQVESFNQYAKSFISPEKIRLGRELFKKHHKLLLEIEKKYRVPAQIIVAIWGDESVYGRMKGTHPLVASLVTLAYQRDRSQYFQSELFAALKMLNHQKIPEQAMSYFDGGLGQPSFQPSVYLKYAVDYDGDGFANIWQSLPDVFASIANYMKKHGWKANQLWVLPVEVPKDLPKKLIGKQHQQSLESWQKLGVKLNSTVPNYGDHKNSMASMLMPEKKGQKGYLVFYNFKVLLRWNNTDFEALSIGLLANEIKK